MMELERLAEIGQYNYKMMVECLSEGLGEEAMLHNKKWLAILDMIRDGKYQK